MTVAQKARPGMKQGVVVRTVAGTVSIGIAAPEGRNADPFKVLRNAEEALAHARAAGMNRITVHEALGAHDTAHAAGLSA